MSLFQWNQLLCPARNFNETEFEDFWITTEDSGCVVVVGVSACLYNIHKPQVCSLHW